MSGWYNGSRSSKSSKSSEYRSKSGKVVVISSTVVNKYITLTRRIIMSNHFIPFGDRIAHNRYNQGISSTLTKQERSKRKRLKSLIKKQKR